MKRIIFLLFMVASCYLKVYSQNGTIEAENGVTLGDNNTTTVDGTLKYDGSDFWGLKAGTWQSLTSSSDAGNNIWSLNADNDTYFLGRVGIGLTNPGLTESNVRLDVEGNLVLRGTNTRLDFKMPGSTTSLGGMVFNGSNLFFGATKSGASLFVQADGDIRFRTNDNGYTEQMVVRNNGNVGIGTNIPTEKLDVNGGIRIGFTDNPAIGNIRYNDNEFEGYTTSGWQSFTEQGAASGNSPWTNSAGNIYYTAGKVGIGTSNPANTFDVANRIHITAQSRISFRDGGNEAAFLLHNNAIGAMFIKNNKNSNGNSYLSVADDNEIKLTAIDSGTPGEINFYTTGGGAGFHEDIKVNTAGNMEFFNDLNARAIEIKKSNVGGEIEIYDNDSRTIKIDGQSSNGNSSSGSAITMFNSTGTTKVQMTSDFGLKVLDNNKLQVGNKAVPTGFLMGVDGKVITEEVQVELSFNWPDYVFEDTYSLLPLDELEAYIEQEGHLPNIPSANEVETNGLQLGEMQRLMMEKIEELTLYIIDLQHEITQLKSEK